MGVLGLWQLLDSSGRPIRLETLEGKTLAIDISIWLNQLVKGYRGAGGASVENAHLIGLFQRVCKLLHFKIKPVFVFDGEAPTLKYQTLASRKRKRAEGDDAIRKATHRMLEIYAKQKLLGEANPKIPKLRPTRRDRQDDMFKLPQTDLPKADESDESMSDTDITYNADLANIKVDSEEFTSLPKELQHEFLVALREREKRGNVTVEELPVDGDDFSTYQMAQVLKKNKLQARIVEVQKEMNDGLLRMAADANVQVILNVTKTTPEKADPKQEVTDSDESPVKRLKIEPVDESPIKVEDAPDKRVEHFLISQWLEGAQRGDEQNETLVKAAQLVRDDTEYMSDSSESSKEERPVRKRLLSGGAKVTAEEAAKLLEPSNDGSLSDSLNTRDTLASDNISLEVGHGSIQSANTARVMGPDERYDGGSTNTKNDDDSSDLKTGRVPSITEGTTDQSCHTDTLHADLEVSETANSLFKTESLTESKPRSQEERSTESSQSCKLVEVKASSVMEEASFPDTVHNSLNSNDDIVLPQNLSRYASKEPSRCNSNSMGFSTEAPPVADNPTDFHQALEIIKEQERRQSISLHEGDGSDGKPDEAVKADGASPSKVNGLDQRKIDLENNNELALSDGLKDVETLKPPQTNDQSLSDAPIDQTSSSNVPMKDTSLTNASIDISAQNGVSNDQSSTSKPKPTIVDILGEEVVEEEKERLEVQSSALQNEINRIERQTNEITTSMIDDCEELLRLFGIPVVRAPREAEAQCAALECDGLVSGVVTDDSDVFLFGGKTVYRNLFSSDKHCEVYSSRAIEARLKLCRDDLIGFAMLTGSDYTNGVENVGPVTACEILSEFKADGDILKALGEFKKWWQLTQRGAAPPKNSVRSRFARLNLDDNFPSSAVYDAYKTPCVEKFAEKFKWTRPDLDLLRKFTAHKFNWTQTKSDDYLLPLLRKFEDNSAQLRIDSLLLPVIQKQDNLFPSKRLKAAVGRIRDSRANHEAKLSESSDSSELDD